MKLRKTTAYYIRRTHDWILWCKSRMSVCVNTKSRLTALRLYLTSCVALTCTSATAQNKPLDSLTVERVSYPSYLSGQIRKDDILIEKKTYELLLADLKRTEQFQTKFATLQKANDSLYNQLNLIRNQLDQVYNEADRLQRKLLKNQIELIRTEEDLKSYQVRYTDFEERLESELPKPKIKYRTRYVFRNRQERRWFWITWGIFLAVPTTVILMSQ